MNIFFSAGEASSDLHAARVLRSLRRMGSIDAVGLGGDCLSKEGCRLLMHAREFSVMGGPLEVASKLPLRRKLENTLQELLREKKVDGALLVDNGEINLRLASLLHFYGVPVVYFIPPKVWVWRSRRLESIADHVSLVLSILPFEREIYESWEIPFEYVGHPIVDEAPSLTSSRAKQILGLDERESVLAVFPGSRHSEIRYHIDLFGSALTRFLNDLSGDLSADRRKPTIVIPVPTTLSVDDVKAGFASKLPSGISLHVLSGKNYEALAASRAALVKSGTSTLEAAYYSVPMVLAYRSSRISEWAYRHVVRYRGYVGMVNLFLESDTEKSLGWKNGGQPVVPEFILDQCRPEAIAAGLRGVYLDGPVRAKQLSEFNRLREKLMPSSADGESPSQIAARNVWQVFTKQRTRENFPSPII